MNYFDKMHQKFFPHLSKRQANDQINNFEDLLFHELPWALHLTEDRQNELVETCLKFKYGKVQN